MTLFYSWGQSPYADFTNVTNSRNGQGCGDCGLSLSGNGMGCGSWNVDIMLGNGISPQQYDGPLPGEDREP